MKIALCLYGQPRHFREAYFINKKNITGNSDVFFHAWHNTENEGKRFSASHGQDGGLIEPKTEDSLVELFQPKRYRVDRQMSFDTTGYHLNDSYDTPFLFSGFSSTYSLKQVGQLVSEWEIEHDFQYELIVATRFDYVFREEFCFCKIHPTVMNTIDTGLGLSFALCDQFWASSSDNMKILFGLHSAMFRYFREGHSFNSERNSFRLMQENNIPMYLISKNAGIFGR